MLKERIPQEFNLIRYKYPTAAIGPVPMKMNILYYVMIFLIV
jgi:hypothetical protein